MNWAYGNLLNIRTLTISGAILAVALSAVFVSPLTHAFSALSFNTAAVSTQSTAISIAHADAVQATALVSSIDDVHSQAELVAYANTVMRADPRISNITIGEHSISMTYATTHSVLHVKTISDETQATVAEDGTVTVSGSFFRPVFAHVAQAASPNVGFSDIIIPGNKAPLSPSAQARVITRLQGRFAIGAIQ